MSAELKTARDFCELIATRITMSEIPVTSFCGRTCRPASVFLAIRSIINDAGVNVDEIAPSTPLAEYSRKHLELFLGPIAKLSPGSLPDVEVDDRGFRRLELIKGLWHVPVLVGFIFLGSISVGYFVFTLTVMLLLMLMVECGEKEKYASVQFGELRTFRDLAENIAAHSSVQFC
ncbi:MAG: hypothetical protein QM501_01345 [Gimesia sp.]